MKCFTGIVSSILVLVSSVLIWMQYESSEHTPVHPENAGTKTVVSSVAMDLVVFPSVIWLMVLFVCYLSRRGKYLLYWMLVFVLMLLFAFYIFPYSSSTWDIFKFIS